MSRLKVIDVGKKYGNMSSDPKYYPKNSTGENIRDSVEIRRQLMGEDYNFDGDSMYMASQKDKRGTYFEITEDYVDCFSGNNSHISEDIIVMPDTIEGVAIGHETADNPVVMGYDMLKRVTAVGHCSPELTDKMLPKLVIDSLLYTYESNERDIIVYISSGAEKYSNLFRDFPSFVKDLKVWSGMIKEDKYGIIHVDYKGAIKRQLIQRGIPEENIIVSNVDTITNPKYYSTRAASLGQEEKAGCNFPCIVFQHEKIREKSRVRTK